MKERLVITWEYQNKYGTGNMKKLHTNFQNNPIDVFKGRKIEIIQGDKIIHLLPEEYARYIEENPGFNEKKIAVNSTAHIDSKIESALKGDIGTDETWPELHMFRFVFSALTNFSGKEIDSRIPVFPFTASLAIDKLRERKNKVFCLTPGVIVLKHMHLVTDYSIMAGVFAILKRNNIDPVLVNNDLLINGKKFFGSLGHTIAPNRVYEEGILTFYYDDDIFRNLPIEYYSRTYHGNKPGEQGITGICNEYPNININRFLEELVDYLGYSM